MSDAVPGPSRRPTTLVVVVAIATLEAVTMLALTVLELASVDASRVGVAVSTAVFFALVGGALAVCARGLWRFNSWARSPIVVAQLIAVLTAWSFRGGETTSIALALGSVSLVALICVLHPATTHVLDDGV